MVGMDDDPEGSPVSFLAQIPGVNPSKLRLRHALRCIGHPSQTEIGAVGEDSREQRALVFNRLGGTKIGKGLCKAGAAANLVQKLGNANAWHQPVKVSVQTLGFRWGDGLGRRYVRTPFRSATPLSLSWRKALAKPRSRPSRTWLRSWR